MSAVILFAAAFLSVEIFRIIFIIIAFLLIIGLVLLFTGFFIINKMIVNDKETKCMPDKTGFDNLLISIALRFFMPFILFVSSIFNYEKEDIRRVYIKANNEYVLSRRKKVSPKKLLVILPHCLQSSKCRYRIREGLNDCHQCGTCSLGQIKKLVGKNGIVVGLATGGTSARKTIKDLKPELVIAVACERDLSSGIMDVNRLPVYGILNTRPNGPCKDTFVNVEEIESMVKHFTK